MTDVVDQQVEFFQKIPIFRRLAPGEVRAIIQIGRPLKFKANHVLFRSGDPGDAMYVLSEGGVRVSIELVQGDRRPVAILRTGDVFGELALLDGAPRSADVESLTDGSVYRFGKDEFDALRGARSRAAYKLLREVAALICRRIRSVNAHVEDMFNHPEKYMQTLEQRQKALVALLQSGQRPRTREMPAVDGAPAAEAAAAAGGKRQVLWRGGDVDRLEDALFVLPIFEGLDDRERTVLGSVFRERRVSAGNPVCREGDPGLSVYIVIAGSVDVVKELSVDRTISMATIGPGNFIGQMALIDGGKRSATCRAVRDAVVIECTRDDFERLFQAANPFTFKLLDKIVEDLARRNRQANRRLSDLYSRPAETLRLLKEALLEIQAPDIDEEAEVRKMLAQQGGSITQQGIPTGGKAGRVEATKRVTTQAVKSFRPGADATEDDT